MAMASAAGIKDEEATVDLSMIKDEDSPLPMDEDEYEETGELEFPEQPQEAWLTRIPQMLHEEWSDIEHDTLTEVRIGYLRTYKNSNKRILILEDGNGRHKNPDVQLNYRFSFAKDNVDNTFIFSEKDLPGYKKRAKEKASGGEKKDTNGVKDSTGVDKSKRYQQFKRAIPKQASLIASVNKEAQCVAMDDLATRKVMKDRATRDAYHGQVEHWNGDPRQFASASSRTNKAEDAFGDIIRGTAPTKAKSKAKAQENKAVRMDKRELIDKLFGCFDRYTYWSMKALKQELKQPENWLKEVLQDIAEMAREGAFTNTWYLKKQNNLENLMKAPDPDDDINIEDEDVLDDAGSENDSKMSDAPE
ncbi:MAG: hypothetical protein M1831_000686 [Alyxoria varia]|nr:MAG: hypothetical protein M1831_000686 [Alyxoria varia]